MYENRAFRYLQLAMKIVQTPTVDALKNTAYSFPIPQLLLPHLRTSPYFLVAKYTCLESIAGGDRYIAHIFWAFAIG